jgi:hypothetical protein
MDIERLNKIIDSSKLQRSQLIIICDPNKAKLMKQNNKKYCIQNVNISLELSKELMGIPKTKRSNRVRRCLAGILHKFNSDVLWIERMQLLFHPELEFDPIQFFQNASRNITIILSWDGEYKNNKLIYAKPGHQEYRVYSEIDAQIFDEI